MNPIIMNAHLLKISLQIAQTPATSRLALEKLRTLRKNVNKMSTHLVQSFLVSKYFTPFVEMILNPLIGSYKLLDLSRNKKLSYLITNSQLNFCRNYGQKSTNKTKRSDKTNDKKKDRICEEDCISLKNEKIKKKQPKTMKTEGISFNVNLNDMINELAKRKNLQKLHEINKIDNFIFKSIDCKTCSSRTKKSTGKSTKADQQKRSNSSYSPSEKIYPKYEMKRKEFKKETYDEIANHNPKPEISSIRFNKQEENYNRRPTLLAKGRSYVESNEKSKGPVPLFMLIKCNSGKTRELIDHYSNNIAYKVGTNEAFIKCSNKFVINKKHMEESNMNSKRSRSERDISQNDKLANFFNNSDATEKAQPYQTRSLCGIPKPETIYKMLKPLIEQEFMQYQEVQTAIQRLENNLETYFNQSKPNVQNINSSIKEYHFDSPLNKKEIREPNICPNISDPSDKICRKIDPVTSNVISAPSLGKLDILDPTEYEIVIIAENCGSNIDKSGYDNQYSVKFLSNSESNDICKKKSMVLLYEDNNNQDQSKKERNACEKQDSHQKHENGDSNNVCSKKLNSASEADESNKKHTCQTERRLDLCKNSKQENRNGSDQKGTELEKKCQSEKASANSNNCLKAKKKAGDPFKPEEDPCEGRKNRDSSKEEPCKKVQKKDDPCRRSDMEPSEEIFKKAKRLNLMPCCEEASLSQEPKMPLIKPDRQSRNEGLRKQPGEIQQVCIQRSCTQKSMETTEPPNCCKPLARKRFYDKPCPDVPHKLKEVTHVKQVCCEELIRKEQEAANRRNASVHQKALPPKKKKVEPPIKLDPPSKKDTRYCTKPAKKRELSPPMTVTCTRIPPLPVPPKIKPKPLREPKQALKDFWFPVKIKTKKIDSESCECKPEKNHPSTKDIPHPSRSPKLSAELPKSQPHKKNLVGSCKGLFSSICKVFCPGKNRSNKRGVSSNTISSSMRDPKGTFGGFSSSAPARSAGNKPVKKPGTMTFAIYRNRNRKYPWNVTPRWSICQERFFSKKSKGDHDPCNSKKSNESEENEADSNKLQCICYEEIRKQAERGTNGGFEHDKKKDDKQLTFKPTNHSKICQMESKQKSECESGSQKVDLGKNKTCLEKGSPDATTSKQSINICHHKLKISPTSTKNESSGSCAGKPGSNTKQENETKKLKTFKERCNPKSISKQAICTKIQERSNARTSNRNDTKNKYPWKKSNVTVDETLCANESIITKKSMKQEKARKKGVKEHHKSSNRNVLENNTGNSCFRVNDRKKGAKQKCETKNTANQAKTGCKKVKSEACKEEKSKENKEQIKDGKQICAQPKLHDIESEGNKNEECAYKKENICERMKKTKRGEDRKPKGVCDKIKEKEKSKERMTSISPKKCNSLTEANTQKIQKIKDVILNDDKEDMFICKVKSLGKSEQLICSSGDEKFQEMKFKEKGVLRLLKCKKIKDEYGRDVYICKEVRPDKDRNAVLQEEFQQMKNLLKQRSLPNIPRERTIVSKKLVCHKAPDGMKKCNMEEVTEIVEGNRKTYVKSAPKKCPFTYQDLLKRSDEVRKADSDRTLEERSKRKDIRTVTNEPGESTKKKIKDC